MFSSERVTDRGPRPSHQPPSWKAVLSRYSWDVFKAPAEQIWPSTCGTILAFFDVFFYFHTSIFKTLFLNYLPPVHSTPPSKTKRCHPYSLKVVTNKKIEKTSVHKARRKWGPLWTVGSYVKWYGHCQMNCEIPGGKNQSIAWSKSLFLDVPPRRIGNRDTEEMSAHSCSFISSGLLSISKMGKQIKCPSTGEQINKQWSKYTMECCPDLKGGGEFWHMLQFDEDFVLF